MTVLSHKLTSQSGTNYRGLNIIIYFVSGFKNAKLKHGNEKHNFDNNTSSSLSHHEINIKTVTIHIVI